MTDLASSQNAKVKLDVPGVFLSGAQHGVGVSTLHKGLVVALKQRELSVATAKVGNSLVETTILRRLSGRLSHSLDPWLLSNEDLLASYSLLLSGAELTVVGGDAPLFDKYEQHSNYGTDFEIALTLKLPIILVVDASAQVETVAAVVHGFLTYESEVNLVGVIANKVPSSEHNQRLKAAIDSLGGPKYLGGMPCLRGGTIHNLKNNIMGLNPSLLKRNEILEIGRQVTENLDLDLLLELSKQNGILEVEEETISGSSRLARIAVADDAAFHLTVQDNLDLLRRAGGDLVAFSPLADIKLPERIGGIYFPGGYPHLYAGDLSANESMIASIREFVTQGGVLYGEGSSIAYLSRKIMLSSGDSYSMCGIVPGICLSQLDGDNYVPPMYCRIKSPAQNMLFDEGEELRGLQTLRWNFNPDEPIEPLFQIVDPKAAENKPNDNGYFSEKRINASTCYLHMAANRNLATRFIDSIMENTNTK